MAYAINLFFFVCSNTLYIVEMQALRLYDGTFL